MIWEKWDDFQKTKENIQETRVNAEVGKSWDAAIYDKETRACIWRCWINKIIDKVPSFELWYWITPEYYGKWIVPECVKRYLQFAFEDSSFEKVILRCDDRNENSKKVALKCWFSHEWTFRNDDRIRWELRDTSFYGITREEYHK
jgi:ribosomal-protein-alanine N-acetyltransferase